MEKLKILLIDDDKDFCKVIKEVLSRTGKYKILVATGGEVGSILARCRWHKPHLILLDIMMSGLDGFELLKRFKKDKRTLYIPVIIVTGRTDLESKIRAEGLYCEDYLVKPFDSELLKS